jgi:micrococcal nuclease
MKKFIYSAKILRVIDGDTVVALMDLGFSIKSKQTLRLIGINAPELHGADHVKGLASKEYLQLKIEDHEVVVETIHDSQEKYGRYLATIWLDGDTVSVNEQLVRDGYAVPYNP